MRSFESAAFVVLRRSGRRGYLSATHRLGGSAELLPSLPTSHFPMSLARPRVVALIVVDTVSARAWSSSEAPSSPSLSPHFSRQQSATGEPCFQRGKAASRDGEAHARPTAARGARAGASSVLLSAPAIILNDFKRLIAFERCLLGSCLQGEEIRELQIDPSARPSWGRNGRRHWHGMGDSPPD